MVEVAGPGGHAAAGEDTGPIAGFDNPAHGGGGAALGGADMDRHPRLGMRHHIPPLSVPLLGSDLAGDVGDDRPIPVQVPGRLSQSGQGVQVDLEVDDARWSASRCR